MRTPDVADVSPPLLSHHLEVLWQAGLGNGARRGRWIDDTLDADAPAGLFGAFDLEVVAR